MNETTVSKYKLFWADQDLEQEQWLRAMACNGLHLTGIATVRWTFVKGEPSDVAYRVDYSSKGRDSDYNRLLEDAGWECAATTAGWHYWRKRVIDGQASEIFTDSASKIERFRAVLALLVALSITSVSLLVSAKPGTQPAVTILFAAFAVFSLYSTARMLLRIRRLQRAT